MSDVTQQPSPESIGLSPAVQNAAAKMRPLLDRSREAFQRGLGDVAICDGARLTFDDKSEAPLLEFVVRLRHGEIRRFAERMRTYVEQTMSHIEERGAACATLVTAGLIAPT